MAEKKKKSKAPRLSEREITDFPKEETAPDEETVLAEPMEATAPARHAVAEVTESILCGFLNSPMFRNVVIKATGQSVQVKPFTIEEIQTSNIGNAVAIVLDTYLKIPDHPLVILGGSAIVLILIIQGHVQPLEGEKVEP